MTGRVEGPSNIILITMTIYYVGSMDVEDTPPTSFQFSVFSFQGGRRRQRKVRSCARCSLVYAYYELVVVYAYERAVVQLEYGRKIHHTVHQPPFLTS